MVVLPEGESAVVLAFLVVIPEGNLLLLLLLSVLHTTSESVLGTPTRNFPSSPRYSFSSVPTPPPTGHPQASTEPRWRHAPLAALLAVTASFCLGFVLLTRFATPMPGYFADARLWARTGHIADTFTPLAYPLFIGPALRWAGTPGVIALQCALQLAMAAAAYQLLRELHLPRLWSAAGALPVALHPDLLASVTKSWDVSLSSFLLLFAVLLCVRLVRSGERGATPLALATGLVFGLGIACRPNYLLLLPAVLMALWLRPGRRQWPPVIFRLGVAAAGALLAFALVGVLSHGSAFWPRNGPYNLYAGHNRRTLPALLADLNAEPSLIECFAADRPAGSDPDPYASSNARWYTHQSLAFARAHPGTELLLVPVKLFTLFRPDTKVHPLGTPLGITRVLLALPVLILLTALMLPPRPRLAAVDRLLLFFELAYILPFLLTNADPRFRTPLDMLLLLHATNLLYRRLRPGTLEPANPPGLY